LRKFRHTFAGANFRWKQEGNGPHQLCPKMRIQQTSGLSCLTLLANHPKSDIAFLCVVKGGFYGRNEV